MHPWYQGRLLRGLEIVVKVGKGVERGRTFQATEVEQKWTDREERFCSGHSKWSSLASWDGLEDQESCHRGPHGRKRGSRQNRNGLRRQLSQTPPFTDDGPKMSGT